MIIKQEFLNTFRRDAIHLLEQHWVEIALDQDTIKMNPDWEMYECLEADGSLCVFTARTEEGQLVGYFVVVVRRNLHYRDHIFAVNDVIYVEKTHRTSGLATSLIQFAERHLREDGVSCIVINTKVHSPFDPLLVNLGFNLIERVYRKLIT